MLKFRHLITDELLLFKYPESKNGFSLLEVLVAIAVLGLIMAGGSGIFSSVQHAWRIQRNTIDLVQNARWATELIANDLRRAGNINVGTVAGVPNTLRLEIDLDGNGLIDVNDARIWYWRGTTVGPWVYGNTTTIYQGIDNPPMNAILVQSFRDEARVNRQELTNFIVNNPLPDLIVNAGPNRGLPPPDGSIDPMFILNNGLLTIELTVRPQPTQPVGRENRNYTLQARVRPRN